jgi:hypothetical protein
MVIERDAGTERYEVRAAQGGKREMASKNDNGELAKIMALWKISDDDNSDEL